MKQNWQTNSKGFFDKIQKSADTGRRRQQNPLKMITSVRSSENLLKHWRSILKGICVYPRKAV